MDVPTTFPGGVGLPDYNPVNYDGKYRGPIQLRYALGNSININYNVGRFSSLIGGVLALVSGSFFYLKPGYVFFTSMNGLFFWCALYFMNISLRVNNLIAVSCIGFLSLVWAFGFGVFFFGEKLKYTDILASLIIFSFNIYTVIFPPKQTQINVQTVKKEGENENEKKFDMK